jgi:hypothetical protein
MLTGSLVVAAIAFSGPPVATRYWDTWSTPEYYGFLALFVLALPLCWLALVSVAFSRYRVRGLWFLTGAPLAIGWLAVYARMFWVCAHGCA